MQCLSCDLEVSPTKCAKCIVCKGFFHPRCTSLKTKENFNKLGKRKASWKRDTCKSGTGKNSKHETSDDESPVEGDPPEMELDSNPVSQLVANVALLVKKFDKLDKKVNNIEKSVEFSSVKTDEVLSKLTSIEKEINSLKKSNSRLQKENTSIKIELSTLRRRLNFVEQDRLDISLEIFGIPETPNENVVDIVKTIATKSDIQLIEQEVAFALRRNTGKKAAVNKMRPILVKVERSSTRNQLVKAIKKKDIMAKDVHASFPADVKIFANEKLTPANSHLFWLARSVAKVENFKFAWVSNGSIYLKKTEDAIPVRIKELQD
ncbi:Hypothetical protein NTJ_14251 [Nesidiocoris tenuis]|uniref:Zinc finger DNA binding protein n=1 Tax=Nesidiocoris tenuis TaxID=355587 RepID=A0ABN7BC57_9HEMI|nr:Hypothetical protein NTJ_14251 [Nesidiocoris tenuis]